ncbi:Mitogen-activated protein kinase kinase kinase 7 [Dermatophagoides pteronyssinus]|uniref:Mitogen-activated protein kinase kinase kinase 7 n=1 Tax=Dermatophagoides pteronyssinus TaxID=6956 RepID=A0ABQ8JGC1_DERPT|nr:Mitogen-activated protein kinase kinase kinase 7 [Dermatophagoides pteronyssinus]
MNEETVDNHQSYNDLYFNSKKLSFIDPSEFIVTKVLGVGTFGFVKEASWKEQKVAIKYFHLNNDFFKEAEQLSLVKHENIITVFGYTVSTEKNGLILEFADGGNLYNFLHANNTYSIVKYTLAHAISWCLQCARAVHYLHSLNILHRDLKPSNLLLTNKCRTIKICDFGTAREKQDTMSINLGTPCWMAPEVFRSKKYTEKCDVFSWGIILWEVLSRKAPYTNFDNNYATLWAIQNGERPPMFRDCPEILRRLITDCWDYDHSKRPSMEKIVKIMEKILSLCPDEANDEIIPIKQENFEYRIVNISNVNTGTNSSNNTIFSDDCLMPRLPKPNVGHKRSNSSDAQIVLAEENLNPENAEISEEKIQELIQYFNAYLFLHSHLVPPTPDVQNCQSMVIFENHRKSALKLYRMKSEHEFWLNRIKELNEKLNNPELIEDSSAHYIHLTKEKINLQKIRSSFAKQLFELMRKKDTTTTTNTSAQRSDGEWILIDNSSQKK